MNNWKVVMKTQNQKQNLMLNQLHQNILTYLKKKNKLSKKNVKNAEKIVKSERNNEMSNGPKMKPKERNERKRN